MAKVKIPDLWQLKREGKKIVACTIYDYQMSLIMERAGVDLLLVGDSGGRYVLGHTNNQSCTMEEMLIMTRSVARGAQRAFVVGDLPFLSYQVNIEEAVHNAGRFIKEAGADGVKLEGGKRFAPVVEAIVGAGIPVLGHIGQTPMSIMGMRRENLEGQSVSEEYAEAMLNDARSIQDAGAFGIVLTGIHPEVAARIGNELTIFTLGPQHTQGPMAGINNLLGISADQIDKPTARYARDVPLARVIYDAVCAHVAGLRAAGPSEPSSSG